MRSVQAEFLRAAPLLADPPVEDRPDTPNLNDAIAIALRSKYVELCLEHRDLDSTVSALCDASSCDELLITRLKKRRLHLKDELARIEGLLAA